MSTHLGDFPTAEQMQEQNDILRQIMAGLADADALDAAVAATLDGTNTTRAFWQWYSVAKKSGDSKYALLVRFAKMAAAAWSDKTYTLRSYDAAVSGLTTMTPLDDLASKSKAQLCTENTEAVADWADEDPMTWYIRANALSLSDGTMNVTYIEGEDGFDITGESAPVYTFALALWIKEWNDGSYDYISFRTTQAAGFYPDAGDVAPDNSKRALTWHPTFPGGLTSGGKLTSGAGRKAYNFASAVTGLAAARQMSAYEGLWNDCDTRWLLRMWQLRHFDLENSGIAEGCTNYNFQYKVALAESGAKRVLVTTAQGANFLVGSTVSIGDPETNTNYDRGQAYMRNLADLVRISSIETVTVSGTTYTALNLEMDSTITVTATTYVSTMPWHSGATEKLPGHKDGCINSLTAGKGPLRVAGVEVLEGAYAIGLDPLYNCTTGSASGQFNYAVWEQRDSTKLADNTTNYRNTGITYTNMPQNWQYVKAFVKTKLGVLFPCLIGGSTTTYVKSAFYGSRGAGLRCPWRFGNLNNGGNAGLACENGNNSPSNANWNGRPRIWIKKLCVHASAFMENQ